MRICCSGSRRPQNLSRVSSIAYFAELRPDPALRRVVLWSGVFLAVVGLGIIATLELPVAPRLFGAGVWLAVMAGQIWTLHRGWRRCRGLRLYADATLAVLGEDGVWRPGRLESDGVVLRHWAWIRLCAGSGLAFAEPLRGSCRGSRDWRRLQVIWRHIGAPAGSC